MSKYGLGGQYTSDQLEVFGERFRFLSTLVGYPEIIEKLEEM